MQKVRPVVREGGQELRRLIYRTLAPEPDIARRVTNAFRSMLLIAPMNRGKTSWAEAMLGETIRYLVEEQGLDEAEIGYVYAEAVDINRIVDEIAGSIDLGGLTYLFIFSDDAAAAPGQHGRRASSRENVDVSQFYIRIRHILRKRYGYHRAVTAVHATQVYHLIDKTFREATDIDVLKALPKSQVDRKQIASLLHPDYVGATFGFLRSLGRKRLLARSLEEFLEAIYTAVVVVDGVPFIVRAYSDKNRIQEEVEERKAWLGKVQNLVIGAGEDVEQTANEQTGDNIIGGFYTYEEALEIIDLFGRIMEKANIKLNGSNIEIRIPSEVKLYVRKRPPVLGALSLWLKGGNHG